MPSKNSINRPKLTKNVQHRQQRNNAKRLARERKGELQPLRSSDDSKSGEIKSVALDIYFNSNNNDKTTIGSGVVTNKTLSKKRAKKIERNLKYAQQRKLINDVNLDKEVDLIGDENMEGGKNKKINNLTKVKDAMWNIIDDSNSTGLMLISNGQGTTLGSAGFP